MLYNKKNMVRWARFELVAELVDKKKHTVQIFFSRNKIDIENTLDVRKYLDKNIKKDEK